jgi:hypothetical protein
MKRLILLALVLLIAGSMYAASKYIIALPSSSLALGRDSGSLRNQVAKLAASGLEVYFYNENYIVAGTDLAAYPRVQILGRTSDGHYYLVTKLQDGLGNDPSTAGEVLLDLGSQILLRSSLDEIQLREKISNPFNPLNFTPLNLSSTDNISSEIAATRTDIQALISQVSADSVLYFIQSMQNLQTRYALANNHLQVANWIKSQFQRFGITSSELHSFQWQGTTQYNVVATIPGTVYPNTYIVVGGHHDSITYDNPSVFAPGADDNASGTVAAIEMARVMMAAGFQPKCSIRFVTFAAEEFGLWGSKAYAQMAQNTSMDIRLMINHDMIANTNPYPDDPRVLLMPYDGYLEHTDHAALITSQYTPLVPVYGSLNLSASDSYSFWERGFPVIYYFEYNFSQVYHSNNDVVANLNPDYCAKVIRASTAVAASYANMPSAPQNFVALDSGTGTGISLSWNAVNDPAMDHYIVYWGSEDGTYPNSQSLTGTSFNISGLQENQTCYVALSTVDTSGNESYRVFASATPRLIPLTPISFCDLPEPQAIQLNWTGNSEVDLAGYKLYRSMDPAEPGELLATLSSQENGYLDQNVNGSLNFYCYRLCAFDTANNQSAFTEVIKSRPVSLDQGVLIIDETMNFNGGSPFQPTDAMVDDFYSSVTDNLNVSYVLDLDANPNLLRLADLGVFSAVLWHGNDYTDMIYPYSVQDVLRQYISYGGKVLFSLYHPSQAFELNAGYPATFGEGTFLNNVLGINYVDYKPAARFKYAISQLSAAPPLEVDPLKTPSAFNGHIFHVEALTPNNTNNTIYTYGSDYAGSSGQGSMNGEKIAVFNQYGSGKVITLSFPLYNMLQPSAKQFVEYAFGMVFDQPVANSDETTPSVAGLAISAAYPNPFNQQTKIEVSGKDVLNPMEVSIYNLKGQLVKRLFKSVPDTKTELKWDGKDDKGISVGSGVYLLKATQNGHSSTQKLLKIK